jgi:Eco29kI restriction endonuclease
MQCPWRWHKPWLNPSQPISNLMENDAIFNPLDKRNLGKSVVDALLTKPERPLGGLKKFLGAGVYALYYRGDYAPYATLSSRNQDEGTIPIYVGKAIPQGGRKGTAIDVSLDSTAIFRRLMEHAESIQQVASLELVDFTYRSLTVDDIWIPLGEAFLIQRFKPLWNLVVEGFGNHTPGVGRFSGKRPLWDELHPGRPWAVNCQPPKHSNAEILTKVEVFMESLRTPVLPP